MKDKLLHLAKWYYVDKSDKDGDEDLTFVLTEITDKIAILNNPSGAILLTLVAVIASSLIMAWVPLPGSVRFIFNAVTNIATILLVVRLRTSQKRALRDLEHKLDKLTREIKKARGISQDLDSVLHERERYPLPWRVAKIRSSSMKRPYFDFIKYRKKSLDI
jgi:hypothetical protein